MHLNVSGMPTLLCHAHFSTYTQDVWQDLVGSSSDKAEMALRVLKADRFVDAFGE